MYRAIALHLLMIIVTGSLARADSGKVAGDVLQFAIPAAAAGATVYYRDLSGFGYLLASGAAMQVSVQSLKYGVNAKRPSGGSKGFPSGHSATAAWGAGFIHRRYGVGPALPAYLATAFVAWSRVESGVHYTRDVVAGVAIGLAASFLVVRPFERAVQLSPLATREAIGLQLHVVW